MTARVVGKANGASASNVYETLRRRIITMSLKPGQSLDEKSLVDQHGVSRTPIREALIRLAGDGLVELTPNRGASVTNLDLETLRAIFEAGDLIEKAIARLACLRRTDADIAAITTAHDQFEQDLASADVAAMVDSNTRFHLSIAQAARNKYLANCYQRVLADHERIGHVWYSHNVTMNDTRATATILAHHRELLDAIIERDAARGEHVSQAHAALCKDGVRAILADGEHLLAEIAVEPIEALS